MRLRLECYDAQDYIVDIIEFTVESTEAGKYNASTQRSIDRGLMHLLFHENGKIIVRRLIVREMDVI